MPDIISTYISSGLSNDSGFTLGEEEWFASPMKVIEIPGEDTDAAIFEYRSKSKILLYQICLYVVLKVISGHILILQLDYVWTNEFSTYNYYGYFWLKLEQAYFNYVIILLWIGDGYYILLFSLWGLEV